MFTTSRWKAPSTTAQAIVKDLFAEKDFANAVNLTAVNSINFARIAAQSVYYFTAAAQLGAAPMFVVPTGNFGDIFAGEAAERMGSAYRKACRSPPMPTTFWRARLNDGVYATGTAQPTLSPSMDIQVASNFERALFEASGRDAAWVRDSDGAISRATRSFALPDGRSRRPARALCGAIACDDDETLAAIARVHKRDRPTHRSAYGGRRGRGL